MAKLVLWMVAILSITLLSCNQSSSSPSSEEISLPTAPPPPPAEAYLGKISPTVLAKLTHMPVMAPAYVPEGFVLADYEFQGSQTYSLIYRNPENQCFAIEYSLQMPSTTEENIGPKTQAFDSPTFGPNQQLYYSASSAKSANSPGQLSSQWLSNEDGFYRLAGAEIIGQNYPAQTLCQNVSLAEAGEIITSIAALIASTTTK